MGRPDSDTYDASKRRRVAVALQRRVAGQSRRRNYGLALIVLTLGFVIGSAWFTMEGVRRQSEATAGTVLKRIQTDELDALYSSLTSEQFRQATSRERFIDALGGTRIRLGALVSAQPSDFHFNPMTGLASLAYDARFDKGKAEIVVTLERVAERWLVLRLRIRPIK